MTKVKTKKDFTEGPLFVPIFLFVIPIILTGMLQMTYNMADQIVVSQFSSNENAVAAIGSTTSLFNLIVNLLMGIAGGAGVVVAQSYGAKNYKKVSDAIHTSTLFAFIGGICFCLIGIILAKPALSLMQTQSHLFDDALRYLYIICLGVPATAVYNFSAAALRSVGDSKTPLIILSLSGLINVLLNLFFVIVVKLSVEGVALATIASQYASAITVLTILHRRTDTPYALDFKKLRIHKKILGEIIKLGLPAGLQGTMFSISNIILTAGINQLSPIDVHARPVAINIESLVHTAMNAYLHAAMTFTGQNYGARKPDRIKKSIFYTLIQVLIVGFFGGQLVRLIGRPLAKIFISSKVENPGAVLDSAMELMTFMLSVYFLCGVMDTLSGALRGLGYSKIPMVISVIAICVIRAIWIFVFFPMERFHSLIGIYTVYPISWSLGLVAMIVALLIIYPRIKRKFNEEAEAEAREATENLKENALESEG